MFVCICGRLQFLKNIKCPDNVLTIPSLLGLILLDGQIPRPYLGWRWTKHSRDGRDEQLTTLEDESTKNELLLLVSYSNCSN